ncbi:hypothetical protein F6X40_36445 [Paraburkholderia sp. UCT31]|uniref:hypothetical protein n=1 Tax=Paraburkholderia sp. UCT31 TaxID=2615209 RepID=UPI0016552BF5|nr:hypothetical protein [Paraburkholderia sp. UCT31]MBC8742032.1 hypothetical protein [Paraburkholderia sp. UCT31]
MAARTKIFIPGKGEFTLTEADHVASGGEGAVYVKKGYAIKLFFDPAKAQQHGMESKISQLSAIQHPFIVAPLGPVYDQAQTFIGYYMPMAKGEPLVKTFTNSWRDANRFEDTQAVELVGNMRDAVRAAHSLGALLVDGNEMNYLAEGVQPRIIDVDSWQIGKHKATALMPSIRDYHTPTFNQGSDWFGWGVVSFQVLTGIHPFKGTHPDFKKADLVGRMQANASVFDPKVKLNSAVRDLNRIPGALKDWYRDVFEKGVRTAPPASFVATVSATAPRTTRVVQSASGSVRHEKLVSLPGRIRHVSGAGVAFYDGAAGMEAFDLQRRARIVGLDDQKIAALFSNQACLVRHGLSHVFLARAGDQITGELLCVAGDPLPAVTALPPLALAANRLVVIDGRPFALNPGTEQGLIELAVDTLGPRVIATVKAVWPVPVQSTRFYDGVAIMDCLGKPFLVVPEGNAVHINRCPALASYRPISAFARRAGFVLVEALSTRDGQMYRLELRLNGVQYDIAREDVIDSPGMSTAINAKGILVAVFDDGEVTVANTLGAGQRVVPDGSVTKDMALFALPDGVAYFRDDTVYRLSLA